MDTHRNNTQWFNQRNVDILRLLFMFTAISNVYRISFLKQQQQNKLMQMQSSKFWCGTDEVIQIVIAASWFFVIVLQFQ